MGTKTPICPTHKDNPKRAEAKKKRGYGYLAIPKKHDCGKMDTKTRPIV